MARATLKVRSNEGLVALSEAHPSARFTVRGAWPTGERLRLLVGTADVDEAALRETLAALSAVEAFEILGADSRRVRFVVRTPAPGPHGAMAGSGHVPPFPLTVEDGWIVGDIVASREHLSQFRDEHGAAGIDYRLVQVPASDEPAGVPDRR